MFNTQHASPPGLDVAVRSWAMATAIIGAYQVAIGFGWKLRELYSGVALYHLLVAGIMSFLGLEGEHRPRNTLHAMAGLGLHLLLHMCPNRDEAGEK